MLLHLLSLLDLQSSPTVLSTLLLFALSKPVHPHQKHTNDNVSNRHLTRGRISATSPHICIRWRCAFGGGGRNRTAVQNTFLFASYSNNLYYILIFLYCQLYYFNNFTISTRPTVSTTPAKNPAIKYT